MLQNVDLVTRVILTCLLIVGSLYAFARWGLPWVLKAVRWVRAKTIDRFKAYVEAPRRDVERLGAEVKQLQSYRGEDVFVAAQFLKRSEEQAEVTRSLEESVTELSSRFTKLATPLQDAAEKFPGFEHRLLTFQQDIGILRNQITDLHSTPDGAGASTPKSMIDVMGRFDALEAQIATLQSQVASLESKAGPTPGVERLEQHAALQHELGEDGSRSEAPRGR